MSELRNRKFRQFFRGADVDGDGAITRSDMTLMSERYVAARGVEPGSPDAHRLHQMMSGFWEQILAPADRDGDGRVQFGEGVDGLLAAFADPARLSAQIEQIADLFFTLADANGDDRIDLTEFGHIFGVAGQSSVDTCADVFARLDRDGSGALSRGEYLGAVREYFFGDDPDAAANHLFGRLTD